MNSPAAFELNIKRQIRAPRAKVFDAFVTESVMRQWMCPRGMTIPQLSVDPRVGGRYRMTMRSRDGESFTVGGEYREIKRPESLAYTWQWEGANMPPLQTLIRVSFTERDGGTEVSLTHTGFPDQGMCDSHQAGWNSSLNNLIDTLDERGSAATVTLIGDPRSSYTRTARMGLAEKGVRYTLQPSGPHSPEVDAVHPFGRIPAFRDGDLKLFETSAILRYADEAFPGPSLLPGNIRDRALCEAWVSSVSSYYYGPMVRNYVLQYIFPKGDGGQPDRAVIDPAVREMAGLLRKLDDAYGARDWIVGNQCSMADLFIAPILAYVEMFPEGKQLVGDCPNVRRAQAAIRARASFKDTQP